MSLLLPVLTFNCSDVCEVCFIDSNATKVLNRSTSEWSFIPQSRKHKRLCRVVICKYEGAEVQRSLLPVLIHVHSNGDAKETFD